MWLVDLVCCRFSCGVPCCLWSTAQATSHHSRMLNPLIFIPTFWYWLSQCKRDPVHLVTGHSYLKILWFTNANRVFSDLSCVLFTLRFHHYTFFANSTSVIFSTNQFFKPYLLQKKNRFSLPECYLCVCVNFVTFVVYKRIPKIGGIWNS